MGAIEHVLLPQPAIGRPQPPIYPMIIGNNGAWLAVRTSSAQGSCGVSGYPCKHPGIDVNGPRGTPVVAPENGVVVAASDGVTAPWRGYGPWLAVIRGDSSGMFHLLAHLDPSGKFDAPINRRVRAGERVGVVSSAAHVHWELRKKLTPGAGQTNFDNNVDPLAWLRSAQSNLGPIMIISASAALVLYLYLRRR